MHYIITGGAGFIGSHCCDALLAQGHDVTILDDFSTGKPQNVPRGVRIVKGDIVNSELVTSIIADADGVFHLAAIASVEKSRTEWAKTTRANLLGTVTVLDAIAARPVPVPCVYASSAAIYGDKPSMPLCEDDRAQPLAAYGVDKYASELHAAVATHIHQIPTSGMRFFNVYGERQDPFSPYSGVISIFANRLQAGRRIVIYGSGEQTRDFTHVSDVVRTMLAAMTRHHTQAVATADIYNVCTGKETSISQLATLLARLTDKPDAPHHQAARTGDIARSLGNPEKAKAELGVIAKTSLEMGLTATLEWIATDHDEHD